MLLLQENWAYIMELKSCQWFFKRETISKYSHIWIFIKFWWWSQWRIWTSQTLLEQLEFSGKAQHGWLLRWYGSCGSREGFLISCKELHVDWNLLMRLWYRMWNVVESVMWDCVILIEIFETKLIDWIYENLGFYSIGLKKWWVYYYLINYKFIF